MDIQNPEGEVMKQTRRLHPLCGKMFETSRIQEHMGTRVYQEKLSPKYYENTSTAHIDIGVPASSSCTGSSYAMIDAIATCSISLHP